MARPKVVIPKGAEIARDEFFFDVEAADRIVFFFENYLTHSKGEYAGNAFLLEDWQKDIFRQLFGWKRISDGTRRYRTGYIAIPRKNGKTTMMAGAGIYLTCADGEAGAEVYSAAGDKDQASIMFNEAAEMIRKCPELLEMCEVQKKAIVVAETTSVYRVLTAEAHTKHGLNASGILFDELHVQPNRDLWDVLTTSVGARRQPLTLAITTAGFDKNTICYEIHSYAEKVRDGIIDDPTFFVRIFAADEKDNWEDEKVWAKANPNLGVTISIEFLRSEYRKAKESPAYENTFKRLYLNIWTEQETRWIPVACWDASNIELGTPGELEGQRCYAALDLSSVNDITAAVFVFPRPDLTFDVLPFFWCPLENARVRERRDRVPYLQWIRDGHLRSTPGNVIDYEFVKRDLLIEAEKYEVAEMAYDPWAATQISIQLQNEGMIVVPFRQGYASLSGPTKQFGTFVMQGRIRHGANPILRWMFSNVAIETDPAGNIKPSKKKAREKIDGVVASIMALGRACLAPDANGSVYANRGMTTL